MFYCLLIEQTIAARKCKFLTKFKLSSNILCRAFTGDARLYFIELTSCMPVVNS